MPELNFRIVNVFTRNGAALSGNPLCVFEEASSLDTTTMQALARQFNLSETTFILPSSTANARVRIFTPRYEMPFAGHPTLGTAHVCRALGLAADALTLEMQAGVIPVRAVNNRWTLRANAPSWRECTATRATIAAMLGISPRDIGERPLWVKAGKEQLIVPLTSEQAVRNVRIDTGLMSEVVSEDGHSMVYVFAQLDQPGRLLSRFFFPVGSAILEDPATGSATANLGGWLIAMGHKLPCAFEISQGEYTGRPSTLLLNVEAPDTILVSGDVIELARGTVRV
jgi:trans-2,3-dihydro-3-hydroxyanthranilate isomerase